MPLRGTTPIIKYTAMSRPTRRTNTRSNEIVDFFETTHADVNIVLVHVYSLTCPRSVR